MIKKCLMIVIVICLFSCSVVPGYAAPIPRFSSDAYNTEVVDGYLYGIREGKSAESVISSFLFCEYITADSEDIVTGTVLTYVNEELSEVKSVTVVIFGDLNGDGKVATVDYMMIKKGIVDDSFLSEASFRAGDVSGDGILKAADYMRVKRHIQGVYDINENSTVPEPKPVENTSKLLVNGVDITEGNYVNIGLLWAEVPFIAVLEALGVEITDLYDDSCEFLINDTYYWMDADGYYNEMTITSISQVSGSGTIYYLLKGETRVEGDFIVDVESLIAFLNEVGINTEIEIGYECKTVNIYTIE
ncbi:MAG: hypothetical protein E7388_03390 [Ruminococcaceae bacterium]|nr:hypothetical protein [Oscillospiraceae bacterium]